MQITTVEIEESTTLAEAVDAHPWLAREFERLGIDFCCGGKRTIAEACATAGLDVAAAIDAWSQVQETTETATWTHLGPAALVDHIEAMHHRYLWDELPRIASLLDKVVSVHGGRHPELADVAACFASIRADLEPHLLKEERVLFPMIRALASAAGAPPAFHCGSLRNPISVMLREHDAVGSLLAHLRRITDGYTPPADGCASYALCFAALQELEEDTHLHIHKENNVLFPLVVALEAQRSAAAPVGERVS